MLNIVIPMVGLGTRFHEKGYELPKPLIRIKNKSMIEWVVSNLKPAQSHRFIFICRREHYNGYHLEELLNDIAPGCKIIVIDDTTEGAACTVLLAKDFIDNNDPLLIANSDQYIDIDINVFLKATQDNIDGLIMTFKTTENKWSFAKVDKNGYVTEVAEKNPISDNATVGVYYYKKGSDFVKGAQNMIRKDIRVNNEFYVCPVFNEFVLADKKIKIYTIAGRLIKVINLLSSQLRYNFNKIYWNTTDEDGNLVANGVYLYKVIISKGNIEKDIMGKLAIVK